MFQLYLGVSKCYLKFSYSGTILPVKAKQVIVMYNTVGFITQWLTLTLYKICALTLGL